MNMNGIYQPDIPPISAYKTAHASDEAALLAERGRIDSSHRMTDDILLYAFSDIL